MKVHMQIVHQLECKRIPNAKDGREKSFECDIKGMDGVPDKDLQEYYNSIPSAKRPRDDSDVTGFNTASLSIQNPFLIPAGNLSNSVPPVQLPLMPPFAIPFCPPVMPMPLPSSNGTTPGTTLLSVAPQSQIPLFPHGRPNNRPLPRPQFILPIPGYRPNQGVFVPPPSIPNDAYQTYSPPDDSSLTPKEDSAQSEERKGANIIPFLVYDLNISMVLVY